MAGGAAMFFFSSRRRHTRFDCDWSSDVCSSDLLLSCILSGLVFLCLEVAALVGFGWWMFHVGVRGSFSAVAFITVLGALSFAGLGMLVASRARTIEAVSGLMNLVMLPMWILSGTFF